MSPFLTQVAASRVIILKNLNRQVNGTSKGTFEVYRGKKEALKLGEMVTFNGEPEVDNWAGECNKIIGTDSTM